MPAEGAQQAGTAAALSGKALAAATAQRSGWAAPGQAAALGAKQAGAAARQQGWWRAAAGEVAQAAGVVPQLVMAAAPS